MIAAAGFLAQEAVSGATWGTFWGRRLDEGQRRLGSKQTPTQPAMK